MGKISHSWQSADFEWVTFKDIHHTVVMGK